MVGTDAGKVGNQPPVAGDIWVRWKNRNLAGEKEAGGSPGGENITGKRRKA